MESIGELNSREVTDPDDVRTFSFSMIISAVRCSLTYVVFPFIAPTLGFSSGVGPWVGVPLSIIGIAANGLSISRFWKNNHRWKWQISTLNVGVIILLSVLLVNDIT
jgi:hypothetical protein